MLTIKCKLVAKKEGLYTIYVFENINALSTSLHKYIMCTKLPNWEFNENLSLNDIGYLQYKIAQEGKQYYDNSTNEFKTYNYTNCYFINFIRDQKEEIINNNFKF